MNRHNIFEDWFEKCNVPYEAYRDFPRPNWINARCSISAILKPKEIKEISWENGVTTVTYEVGKMNFDNLKRLRKYLESKDYNILGVYNDEFFQLPVIRVVFEPCTKYSVNKLARDLKIPEPTIQDITGDMVFIQTSALRRHLNDGGLLEFEKPFDLMDYEFKQQFSTLNPIRCQLRKHGVNLDTIDIWDDYLMIKSDCSFGTLDSQHIRKALNIGKKTAVHCVEANKCYAVDRWK